MEISPSQLIAQHVVNRVSSKVYPSPLPGPLDDWYVYQLDGGHSIAVAIKSFFDAGAPVERFLCTVPVRTVQRLGWEVRDGFVVCDVPYDPEMGPMTEDEDDEF
ncbi:hypothetical protein [Nocardia sp. NPDC050710]|uniref:hypothetical protein n=1 Tax=Nocardia sp. NPDC050710 TaxID=3157220 RepID=UPI0033FA1662